jgi:hypothetical protein
MRDTYVRTCIRDAWPMEVFMYQPCAQFTDVEACSMNVMDPIQAWRRIGYENSHSSAVTGAKQYHDKKLFAMCAIIGLASMRTWILPRLRIDRVSYYHVWFSRGRRNMSSFARCYDLYFSICCKILGNYVPAVTNTSVLIDHTTVSFVLIVGSRSSCECTQ